MREFKEFKSFINGKNVAVVGIGVSNIPLINFLVKLGAEVTAFDMKEENELGKIASEFKSKGVKLELGKGYLEKLTGFEVERRMKVRILHLKWKSSLSIVKGKYME